MRKIKSIEIVTCKNMINPSENSDKVRSLVVFQIYTALETSTKASMSKSINVLTEAFPGMDYMTINEELLVKALGSEVADIFKGQRDEILEIREKISETGVTGEEWEALTPVDKINITLISHQNARFINLTKPVLKDADVDLAGIKRVAENWLENNNINGCFLVLKPIIHKMLGQKNGKYFYGLKVRNSGIENKEVVGFCSQLVKDAHFTVERKNKERCITGYNYSLNTNAGKIQSALTGFLGVVATNKSVEVMKPVETTEEIPQPAPFEATLVATPEGGITRKKSTRKSKKSEKVA